MFAALPGSSGLEVVSERAGIRESVVNLQHSAAAFGFFDEYLGLATVELIGFSTMNCFPVCSASIANSK